MHLSLRYASISGRPKSGRGLRTRAVGVEAGGGRRISYVQLGGLGAS